MHNLCKLGIHFIFLTSVCFTFKCRVWVFQNLFFEVRWNSLVAYSIECVHSTLGNYDVIEQAQICAEGCEGENFTQILSEYCSNIVQISSNYYTTTEQILYIYCENIVQNVVWILYKILCKYCENIVKRLSKYFTNTVQILRKYSTNIVQILYIGILNKKITNFANIAQIKSERCANIVQIFYKYCTNILQILYR